MFFSEGVFDPNGLVCLQCAKRRCERKEIITEIIETEIKYGRDLRIIQVKKKVAYFCLNDVKESVALLASSRMRVDLNVNYQQSGST